MVFGKAYCFIRMNLGILISYVGTLLVALFFARNVATPFQRQLRLIALWLLIAAAPIAAYWGMTHSQIFPDTAAKIGFTPLFPGYRQLALHKINQPKPPGMKRIVILGPSNMAGWGADHRASYFDFRHKHDIWGRASIGTCLEKELTQAGIPVEVENLGVNAGDVFAELSLFLYALERQPDLIIHGQVATSYNSYDPHMIPELRNELLQRLRFYEYPDKARLEKTIQSFLLADDSGTSATPTISPTRWDAISGLAGQQLVAAYKAIGLPPLTFKPERNPPTDAELQKLFNRPPPSYHITRMENALKTYADVPLIQQRIAQSKGVPFVVVLPPDSERCSDLYYKAHGDALRAANIPVIDLSHLGLKFGTETYDGCHGTLQGNTRTSHEIVKALKEQKIFP